MIDETVSDETVREEAYPDYLGARNAAIEGAAGYFVISNVSSDILRTIIESTTDSNIALAARTVLFTRGELTTASGSS